MSMWKCCAHCEKPCPKDGHSKPCKDCDGRGTGVAAVGEVGRKRTAYGHYLLEQGQVRR